MSHPVGLGLVAYLAMVSSMISCVEPLPVQVYIPAIKEPTGLIKGGALRPDGMTLTPCSKGRSLTWDVTVIHTLAQTNLAHSQGRIQEFIWGAKPSSPIESWGRSPNRGGEAPENRGGSPSRRREAPENWGQSPNRGRSPRKNGERGLGRGLGEPLPRKCLKNPTSNHSF